jgi:adenylyl-sulfate kinase
VCSLSNKAHVFWFSGLSGSGKTTIANRVMKLLKESNYNALILDGDDVRARHKQTLGFSKADITLNNRLILDLCIFEQKNYNAILVPVISPFRESRLAARKKLGNKFSEIYFSASLETVVSRDVKGLYRKAQQGIIHNMIGYSGNSPYEKPRNPDYVVDTEASSIKRASENFFCFIEKMLSEKSRVNCSI